jgi:hypothetical protein
VTDALRVLVDDDVDDDDLREAANAAYRALLERGVDVDGVAPVLRDREVNE